MSNLLVSSPSLQVEFLTTTSANKARDEQDLSSRSKVNMRPSSHIINLHVITNNVLTNAGYTDMCHKLNKGFNINAEPRASNFSNT